MTQCEDLSHWWPLPNLEPFTDAFQNPALLAPVSDDGRTGLYRVTMRNGQRRLHGQLPADTPYWGYEGRYPGPTIEVPRDREVVVTFTNDLEPPPEPQNARTQWPFAIAPDESPGMP